MWKGSPERAGGGSRRNLRVSGEVEVWATSKEERNATALRVVVLAAGEQKGPNAWC